MSVVLQHLNTDQAALLASVLAKPEDDAPRLVLADWYDEHGQGERAEFIRVQVELARMDDRRESIAWAQLRRRERAILREWIRWPNGSEGVREACWYEQMAATGIRLHDLPGYRRGFVAEVRLTTAAFLGGPCGRCAGTGVQTCDRCSGEGCSTYGLANAGECTSGLPCPACEGSGHTTGLAAVLFAAHPVERVVLLDKRPVGPNPGQRRTHAWIDQVLLDGAFPGEGPHEYGLPPELFSELPGRPDRGEAGYPTADAAHASLSAACVRYGRKAARVE